MISESVFHFRSLSGSYASLSVALVDLSTSRGRLAECTNRLQLTALIRERRRGGMSRRGRCFLPEFRGAPAHRVIELVQKAGEAPAPVCQVESPWTPE